MIDIVKVDSWKTPDGMMHSSEFEARKHQLMIDLERDIYNILMKGLEGSIDGNAKRAEARAITKVIVENSNRIYEHLKSLQLALVKADPR